MRNSLILLIFVGLVSCASIQEDASSPVIQLTKKRCMGKCPVYDLMIYKNGLVTYNGIDHVKKIGLHQFNISNKKLEALNKLFEDSRFKELESTKRKGRDFAVTQLTYQNKMVSFQGPTPKRLNNIIVALELITE